MINSKNDKLQYRDSEIIILGCPKINNLFILILIPGLKLLCLASLFEPYCKVNLVLETLFQKKVGRQLLHYPLTSNEIEAVELLRKSHWPVVGAVGTRFWIFFHGLLFFGHHDPDFNPWPVKECLDH